MYYELIIQLETDSAVTYLNQAQIAETTPSLALSRHTTAAKSGKKAVGAECGLIYYTPHFILVLCDTFDTAVSTTSTNISIPVSKKCRYSRGTTIPPSIVTRR